MRYMLLALVLIAGCSATDDCPESLAWSPLTCRCHSNASGGFVSSTCCLKPNVSLDACPTTEPSITEESNGR